MLFRSWRLLAKKAANTAARHRPRPIIESPILGSGAVQPPPPETPPKWEVEQESHLEIGTLWGNVSWSEKTTCKGEGFIPPPLSPPPPADAGDADSVADSFLSLFE